MSRVQQRRIARIFMLVLALELVLLCCACSHLSVHACGGEHRCAICAFVHVGLRRAAIAGSAAFAFVCLAALFLCVRAVSRRIPLSSPVLCRVRLND